MLNMHTLREKLNLWAADEFHPKALPASLLSAILIYALGIILAISFAALIFSGSLAASMPQGIGFLTLGNAIIICMVALLSSYPGAIAVSQDTPAVVLALVGAAIALDHTSSPAQQFATALVMVVLVTVTTGLLFILLGSFKLGGLMRFLPYPVMGGFLAGSGWLLVKGGAGIMAGLPIGAGWLTPGILLQWLPGTLLGIFIYISVNRTQKSMFLPGLLGAAAAVFYVVVIARGLPFTQLEAQGWVVGAVPQNSLANFPLSPANLAQVNWSLLWNQLPHLVPVVLISVIALLLNCGGLELFLKKDLDLNRELLAAGTGNLLAGLVGGPVGYQSISLSALNYNFTNGKRLPGLLASGMMALTILLGSSILMYIPKLVIGAVLVYLGLGLLVEWIYRAWFKFPRIDFAIILSIFAVIIFSDFLNGIILGLVEAVIMFVVSYSQINVVKFEMLGREYRSRVVRSPRMQRLLNMHGDKLYIMRLQGFIFFGTANNIFSQVREQIQKTPELRGRFFLLDFNHVSGLDSTGLYSFERLMQMAEEHNITVVLTGLRGRALSQFQRGGFHEHGQGGLRIFPDIDHGVEWCEDQIIMGVSLEVDREGTLVSELAAVVGEPALVKKLVAHLHRQEFKAGEYLLHQGDEPDVIYLIESGQVSIQREMEDREPARAAWRPAGGLR